MGIPIFVSFFPNVLNSPIEIVLPADGATYLALSTCIEQALQGHCTLVFTCGKVRARRSMGNQSSVNDLERVESRGQISLVVKKNGIEENCNGQESVF